MKRLLTVIAIALLLPLNAMAQSKWVEGTHYNVISAKASAKPEIKEFFSFWCPACYRFETIAAKVKENMGENVKFTKVHVNFMRFTGPAVQDQATRAMAIGKLLKDEDKYNGVIFDFIHQKRGTIAGLDDLRSLFIASGVEAEKFDKLAKSFGVNSMVLKNNKQVEKFRDHVNGVPNIIVNDKYQATFTRSMTADDMIDLILWLTKQS